ncbi:MAG: NADH-quinone oxidoreductase subunit M [Planctomycetota bacterium]|nr:MAG: NADH-quinone oxidoreductase subunit M [Planctomycetota bacterium]
MDHWLLTLIIFSPLAGIVLVLLPRTENRRGIARAALAVSLVTLVLTLLAVKRFAALTAENGAGEFVLTAHVPWIGGGEGGGVDIGYRVGIDGISLWLLVLTALLSPLAIGSSFTAVRERAREYYILLLLLEVGLLGVFCARDLLLFYVFFEFTLIPLYFLIGIWGGEERRRAANKFFIYTVAGSVLTFAGLVYLAYFAYTATGTLTLNLETLTALGQEGKIPPSVQWWVFLALAAGFAIKVPLFPFHTWLPLAHTEAPTAGSVILAGVLLKLGTYGFCRLSLPILPDASFRLAPVVAVLAIIGIIYAALAAWVQRDVKKLVAYSSVSHLGFCMLGLFSLKVAGVSGGVLYMVNHGLSTGALFLVVGFLYERYHTRDIEKIGGLARPMPWLAFFLVFFTLSSIGLPGLNGFVGEFLVLLGTATSSLSRDGLAAGPLGYAYVVPAALGIILGAVYMLWMCQRVLFGPLREPPDTPDTSQGLTPDLTRREIAILTPIALGCLALGVYPKPVLEDFESAVVRNILVPAESSVRSAENLDHVSSHTLSEVWNPSAGEHDRMDDRANLDPQAVGRRFARSTAPSPVCVQGTGRRSRPCSFAIRDSQFDIRVRSLTVAALFGGRGSVGRSRLGWDDGGSAALPGFMFRAAGFSPRDASVRHKRATGNGPLHDGGNRAEERPAAGRWGR